MTLSHHGQELAVSVSTDSVALAGDLILPQDAEGIVLFAHGSGSSRFSPRNRFVAHILHQAGLATLLMDLLTSEEEALDLRTSQLRFNIQLLAKRVAGAIAWLANTPITQELSIGLFGASTGAAAAIVAAAACPDQVKAVVSRGGRPDLAGSALSRVRAPTLLIVGEFDHPVIEMNQAALQQISAEKGLEIIPGASHLFEERGTLDEVAHLASLWFSHYLAPCKPYRIA